MIVCLSPNRIYLDETVYSIKYAEKAMKIKRREVSKPYYKSSLKSEDEYKSRIQTLESENRYLRRALEDQKNVKPVNTCSTTSSESRATLNMTYDQLESLLYKFEESIVEREDARRQVSSISSAIKSSDSEISQLKKKFMQKKLSESEISEKMQQLVHGIEGYLSLKENIEVEIKDINKRISDTKGKILVSCEPSSAEQSPLQKAPRKELLELRREITLKDIKIKELEKDLTLLIDGSNSTPKKSDNVLREKSNNTEDECNTDRTSAKRRGIKERRSMRDTDFSMRKKLSASTMFQNR